RNESQVQQGLYEQLITVALQQDLDRLADPRLYHHAPVEPEDSHTAIAQLLEHVLVNCLAMYRGKEAAQDQQRLVDRILTALTEEIGTDWTQQVRIATPLRRLLAIYSTPRENPIERPDTPLARSALLTGTRLDPSLGSQLCKEIATADR